MEYDGTAYHGWQRQPVSPTVQEVLEDRLQAITGEKVIVMGAGRTDAGVHALGQVASFRSASHLSPEEFGRALNAHLPSDIQVKRAFEARDDFHPQFGALSKTYLYLILNRPETSPLLLNRCWQLRHPLNMDRMSEACALILGEHDFSSFKSSSGKTRSQVRRLTRVETCRKGSLLEFWFEADGFLKNMIRNIIGTLVDIGSGRYPPEVMGEILEARDRTKAGPCAPPQGLYLVQVRY